MNDSFAESYKKMGVSLQKSKWKDLGPSIVVYNHDLNDANIGILSPLEQNAFFYVCAKVRGMEGDFINIPFDEYKRQTRFPMRKSDKDLINSFDRVATALKYFEFRNKLELNGFERGAIFTYFKADAVNRVFTVKVNDMYLYLFNKLEEEGFYTRFNYKSFVQVEGKHSKTLFRLISQWKTKGKTPYYPIEYLKFLTGTEKFEDRNVRSKVIAPAVEECSKFFKNLKTKYSDDKKSVAFTFVRCIETPILPE